MICRRLFHHFILVLAGAVTVAAISISASAQHYQVTITNLTSAQTLTPIMVATHKPGVKLFTLGEAASVDMEQVAEAGDLSGLEATLRGSPQVLSVMDTGVGLPPGQSVTVKIATSKEFSHVSVTSMLVPTNDAFFAINDEDGPARRSVTFYSPAYDAGTEANDELCAHIPGPAPVCAGEGFNAERPDPSFVHIHSAIHGIGDLSAATYDWRNPVAKIVITRAP